MRSLIISTRNNEKGQAMAWVVVYMVLASVIVVTLLSFTINGSHVQSMQKSSSDKLYAADAGVRDALWEIKYNKMNGLSTYNKYDFSTTGWSYNGWVSGAISSIAVTEGGSGYSSTPTVSISGGSGSGASATAVVKDGQIIKINVTDGGSGYTTRPTVSISGGGGSGATAEASMINNVPVDITIRNSWMVDPDPDDYGLSSDELNNIIEFGNILDEDDQSASTGSLIIKGLVIGAITTSVPASPNYQIIINYTPGVGETLGVNSIGIWMPAGFTYVSGSCNLENDESKDYDLDGITQSVRPGGNAVVWGYSAYPFTGSGSTIDPLPNVSSSQTTKQCKITFKVVRDVQTSSTQQFDAVSWITTDLSDLPFAWDDDIRYFKITSNADGVIVDAYTTQVSMRQLGASISGDYFVIGNTLMEPTTSQYYRDRLYLESSGTLNTDTDPQQGIPANATLEAAYLYWSGWQESGGTSDAQIMPTGDGDLNGTWNSSTSTQIRVPTGDGDINGTWNSSPRWDDVDETTPDDNSSYMTGTTTVSSEAHCLFTFPAFDIPAGATVNSLTVYIAVSDNGASGSGRIYERIKVNGSYYNNSTYHSPSGSGYTTYSYTWTTNPNNSGQAWTAADIEGTSSHPLQQFGVYSTDLAPDIRVTMVYAEVSYTSTTRYDLVDETTPDNNSSYMTGTTDGGGYCLFTFPAFGVPAGATVNDFTVHIAVSDNGASGSGRIIERIKVNGSYYDNDTYHSPSGSGYSTYYYTWDTNPQTGIAWTTADIEGTGSSPLQQFGVYSTDLNPDIRVTMVYAEVSYTTDSVTATKVDRVEFTVKNNTTSTEYPFEITADSYQTQPNTDASADAWSYSCYKDVTGIINNLIESSDIPSNGCGDYTLGHVVETGTSSYNLYDINTHLVVDATGYPLSIPALNHSDSKYQWTYAGWSLIFIYSSPDLVGTRQLYLFDEFRYVGLNDTLTFPISGFLAPSDTTGSHMTYFVGEGDNHYSGEYISLNGYTLPRASDPYEPYSGFNPQNNPFNSYSNSLTDTTNSGVDIDTFDVSTCISAGSTSATVVLDNGNEIYDLVFMILSFRSDITTGGTVSYLIRES